jgi:hypothetical protein
MGLALRTSALLEPLAAPGCALVEERFHQFAGGREKRSDAIDGSALQDVEELAGKFMAPLSQSDLADIDYDRDDQKFILRKNLLDLCPPNTDGTICAIYRCHWVR